MKKYRIISAILCCFVCLTNCLSFALKLLGKKYLLAADYFIVVILSLMWWWIIWRADTRMVQAEETLELANMALIDSHETIRRANACKCDRREDA